MSNGDDAASQSPRTIDSKPDWDWDTVIARDERAEEALAATSEVLNENLGDTRAGADIAAILDRQFPPKKHTPELFREVRTALERYLGWDTTALIWWLSQDDDEFSVRIELASRYLSKQSMQNLRLLLAKYGSDLRLCLSVFRYLPDDWRTLNREIWYDEGDRRHQVHISILKHNDESLRLKCFPVSVLNLAKFLIQGVGAVPNITDYIGEEEVSEFRSAVDSLFKKFGTKQNAEEEPEVALRSDILPDSLNGDDAPSPN